MVKALSKVAILTTVLALASVICPGQAAAANPQKTRPIEVGELLTYEGKLSKIIPGITVADLRFEVQKDPNSDGLVFKTMATSKGTLLKLFRFSFLQQYESLVDNESFRILKTTKHDVQKDRVRDSEAVFDYKDKRVRYTETDPTNPNRPPRRIASVLNGMIHDIVSGIYAIRRMPLVVGHSFEMTVSDSGLVYTVPVRVTAREQQKSILGRSWCYRVEPAIFGHDRMIEQKGGMIIWLTDDARRIPVRSRIDTEFGRIEVRLRTVSPAVK